MNKEEPGNASGHRLDKEEQGQACIHGLTWGSEKRQTALGWTSVTRGRVMATGYKREHEEAGGLGLDNGNRVKQVTRA